MKALARLIRSEFHPPIAYLPHVLEGDRADASSSEDSVICGKLGISPHPLLEVKIGIPKGL